MNVSVMYPVGAGQKFDLDYYMKTHVPLVGSLTGPAGLKGAQVLQGIGSPNGDPAGYPIIALVDFEFLDPFKAAADAHGPAVFGDIPNFTDGQPVIHFNERLA
jgi:uncharacterized protein (TIGR02118 family)